MTTNTTALTEKPFDSECWFNTQSKSNKTRASTMANINLGKKLKINSLCGHLETFLLTKSKGRKLACFLNILLQAPNVGKGTFQLGAYNLYLIFEDPYSSLKKSISHSTKVCNIHVYNHILSTLNNNIQYIAAREVYPFMVWVHVMVSSQEMGHKYSACIIVH